MANEPRMGGSAEEHVTQKSNTFHESDQKRRKLSSHLPYNRHLAYDGHLSYNIHRTHLMMISTEKQSSMTSSVREMSNIVFSFSRDG